LALIGVECCFRLAGVMMDSTVKTRPSHYEALGLEPTASDEEIARAFARQISAFQPRAFGGIAAVSVAYEVLRDPVRRRAYDESIGIKPQPKPAAPTKIAFQLRQEWRTGAFSVAPPKDMETVQAPDPELVDVTPDPVGAAAEPALVETPQPEAAETARVVDAIGYSPPPVAETPSLERQFEQLRAAHSPAGFDWKRPALIVGTLFLGAAAIGGFAGWKSVENIEPEQAAKAATVGRSADQANPVVVPGGTAAERLPARAAERPMRTARARAPGQQQAPAKETSVAEVPADSIAEEIQVVDSATAAMPVDEPATVESTEAAMPLPNRTIARTLARIGYPCGDIASTTPAGGAGVFKVTCTSGHSYRAAPVRGRYHFRRWG
jgi:hypothetical protein